MISSLRSASKEAWVSATMGTACSSELSAIAHKLRPLGVPYKDWPGWTSHGAALTGERDDWDASSTGFHWQDRLCTMSGYMYHRSPKTPQRRAFLPFATLSNPRTWRLKSLA